MKGVHWLWGQKLGTDLASMLRTEGPETGSEASDWWTHGGDQLQAWFVNFVKHKNDFSALIYCPISIDCGLN